MAGVKGSGCGAPKGHAPYPGCETGGVKKTRTPEYIEKQADMLSKWLEDEKNYWFKDFCLQQGLHPDVMSLWSKQNEKFNEVYKRAQQIQESRIFKGAMSGVYNSTMAKMGLVNRHSWVDKVETKISGDSQNPISFLFGDVDGRTKELVDADESST